MSTGAMDRAPGLRHIRHSVAKWRQKVTLRTRLSLLVALVTAAVITALTSIQIKAVEQTIEQELADVARTTARALVNDLKTASALKDEAELRDWLHDVIETNAEAQAITVLSVERGGVTVLASTSSQERADTVVLSEQAVMTGDTQESQTDMVTTVAVPVEGESLAVAVTVSMAPARRAHERLQAIALWFAPPTVIVLTLLVDWLTRRYVHGPVAGIQDTMQRAARGDLSARASVQRRDEIGSISEGLNDMLGRMEHFNEALRERVREATAELRQSNAEVEESYRRVLSLREALARAERMAALGQMAANVAHQVGTPLNLISGYVQMVRDDPAQDTRTRERLEIVERQIQQVTRILRTMLDQARQPQRSQREVTSIDPIIERVTETARPRIDRAGVQLDVQVETDLPAIEADATQLELALLALITNGLDAMPNGGTLGIHAARSEKGIHLEITDTGTGIPPELLSKVFEPWFTTKGVEHGTGLGLPIARDVVISHGGTIGARNRTEGGAVLTIELPCLAS